MANLPETFPIPPPSAIASYDYVDVAEGTGLVKYYGTDFQVSGATIYTSYGLIQNPLRSTSASTAPATTRDYNFDLTPFNLPKTVKGTAHFQIKLQGAAGNAIRLSAQLKKVSGTDITNVTDAINSINSVAVDWINFQLPCTQTHFKKGDILRLTLAVVAAGTGKFFHDPSNASANSPPDSMWVHVPFKIID